MDLASFLQFHEGQWFSPYEIARETKHDIRVIKNNISRLQRTSYWTAYDGFRLDVAERGKRIYAIRMVRDIENSVKQVDAEIEKIKGSDYKSIEEIETDLDYLLDKLPSCLADHDTLLRHFNKGDLKRSCADIVRMKDFRLKDLENKRTNLLSLK